MENDSKEKGLILITPMKSKEEEGSEKNSRSPSSLTNSYSKVRSRYLNAPTGSCHDLCKYGHKHQLEEDGKHAIFRRFMTNKHSSNAVQNHLGDIRKSPGLKLNAFDKKRVVESNNNHTNIDSKDPYLENCYTGPPLQPISLFSSIYESDHSKGLNSNNEKKKKKKMPIIKQRISSALNSAPTKQSMLELTDSPASAEITSGAGPNVFKEAPSDMKKTAMSSTLKQTRKKSETFKHSVSSKMQSEKIGSSAKQAISRKENAILESSTSRSMKQNGSRNLIRKTSNGIKLLKYDDNSSLKQQKAAMCSTTPAHGVSLKQRKYRNTDHANHERDKTPNIGADFHERIKEITEEKSYSDDGYASSDSCFSDVSELSETEDVKEKKTCVQSRARRTMPVLQPGKSSLPYKMKFRRGRVIDIDTTEKDGSRRLRFRKGRVLDEKSNGEGTKRFLRRRGVGDMKAPGTAAHANSSGTSTVKLKHQEEAQEKKNKQALYNQMIEETASKLVETQSRVKALVGAFETVISLQETKAAQPV